MLHVRKCIVCDKNFKGRNNQLYCSQKCKTKYHNQNRKFNVYEQYTWYKDHYETLEINYKNLVLAQDKIKEQVQSQVPVQEPDKNLIQELQFQNETVSELAAELANEKQRIKSLISENETFKQRSNKNNETIKQLTEENLNLNDLLKNKISKIQEKQKELKEEIKYKTKTIEDAKQKELKITTLGDFILKGLGNKMKSL